MRAQAIMLGFLLVGGCAPNCRITVRPASGEPVVLETRHAYFCRGADSYRLLAVVPSRPDSLSALSPDGGTPAYYLHLTLPRPESQERPEAQVIIRTHHAAGIFRGIPDAIESAERGARTAVRCNVLLERVPGRAFAGRALLDGACLQVLGEFHLDSQAYARRIAEIEALERWFARLYQDSPSALDLLKYPLEDIDRARMRGRSQP